MPRKADAPDTFAEVAGQVIADNVVLRARAEKILTQLFDGMERTIRIADPKEMAIYNRAIVPTMLRSLQDKRNDEESDTRAAFERVMAAVRGVAAPPPG